MPRDAPPPRIALFRATEDAEASADALRDMGYEAVSLPVIETRPLAVSVSKHRYDAILATSAKAFLAGTLLDRRTPLYAVGERTVRAGEASGWRAAALPAPDAASLAVLIRERLPHGASLIYLAGRDRKPLLEEALGADYALETVETYAAEARPAFRPDEAAALAACRGALHYSRRSAGLAAELAERAGGGAAFRTLIHICISADASAPIEALGAAVRIAGAATEMSLFAALREALP